MGDSILIKVNGIEFSKGNHKLGKDTIILNITSATDCPARKLGLCTIPKGKCYALKAERKYRPKVLPYRRRQTKIWDKHIALQIAATIVEHSVRAKYKVKYLRFSEAGDFRNQADVGKMSRIAEYLKIANIGVYGYTSRKDLKYKNLSTNLCLNGTGFNIDNMILVHTKSLTKAKHFKRPTCKMNCRVCNLCKEKRHTIIYFPLH